MATDNIAGHTAAQNTLGEDGLRDGDSLSPSTLTNALQGIHGNGIIRYQDGAFGSTRNDTNTGNQPGSMVRATASTLTVSGGFAVLDGALYEFGTGVGDSITLDLNDGSHGSGALSLSANEEAIYTIYVAPSGGVNKVHYEGGSPVDTTTGVYPSASNQYLINYKTLSNGDNAKAIVLAQVRVQYIASGGGSNNLNIIEVNDKRIFLKSAADYRVPLSTGSVSTGAGASVAEIADGDAQGINTIAHLNAVHNDNGELAVSDTVNVNWVSHPRYGSFAQTPPGSSDAGYGQGPSRGADRGTGHVADAFYFAGRNNQQTGHYSVRLQGKGVDATSTALTTNGTWVVTAEGDSFFMLAPNAGVVITLQPEKDGTNYKFPEGHTIEVCNNGLGNIIFDDLSGSNETVGPAHRATFIYEGSVWVRCDYQSAIIAAGPTPAIYDNSGTPAFTTGITKAEVQTLLNIEDNADVTDATNVTTAGALMDSEVTNLAQVKAFDTSDYATAAQGAKADSAQQPPSEGAFANGDKTKLDAIAAGATAYNDAAAIAAVEGEATLLLAGDVTMAIGKTLLVPTGIQCNALQLGYNTGPGKLQVYNAGDNMEIYAAGDSNGNVKLITLDAGTDGVEANRITSITGHAAVSLTLDVTGNILAGGTVDGRDLATDGSKLDGIEASATADQTDAEIRAAVEAATDSNVFTDADHSKLNAIEASADVTDTTNVVAALTAGTNITIAADGTIAASGGGGGTAPAIEDNSGTPVFASGITKAELHTLLNIEDNADVTDTANVTSAGALMDSEVTNLAQVKAFNTAAYATAAQGVLAAAALPAGQGGAEPFTPALGGGNWGGPGPPPDLQTAIQRIATQLSIMGGTIP